MELLEYKDGILCCDHVSLLSIAKKIKTPCYVYSATVLTERFNAFNNAMASLPHLVCFAVKANSNLSVLKLLAGIGAGADVVSGGELFKAMKAGIPASRIVYSSVGKTKEEIRYALKAGILMFNVESEPELRMIQTEARRLGKRAPISIRVNPDVDPQTHPYISTGLKKNKFGLSVETAFNLYKQASTWPEVEIKGIDCHIGSQLTSLQPFLDAMDRILSMVHRLKENGISLQYIDVGGGLGIRYKDETPPTPQEYGAAVCKKLASTGLTVIIEPGRAVCGNAGGLLTKVIHVKDTSEKRFYIVDAAMNDLVRPSLYQAYHEILPLKQPKTARLLTADVVGPICESGDFLAKDRELPRLKAGDFLLVKSAGAYGFTMSSNYNARPRAAEVMIEAGDFRVVRRRETFARLIQGEIFI
ncbi:MAG: diaminopimelate decarboxylase [Dissulfuribacterales bacterium]